MASWKIGDQVVGTDAPTYFIADISANHDGELGRARSLIELAKEAGADAAKFQNFRAQHIVSAYGFDNMGGQQGHQASWKKSVVQVYEEASLPWEWTQDLKSHCDNVSIEFMSTPYDLEAVDMLDPMLSAYKIGSGDITWSHIIKHIADKGKPVLLAAGASTLADVERAVSILRSGGNDFAVMQCNTNYTGSPENFAHIHLNVLKSFSEQFPDAVLGLSDHTPGHATVLGAVTLGARIVEKHFTDDTRREGPDHPFSMSPDSWAEMVLRTRELELALGQSAKVIAGNERETLIVQRRCLRAARELSVGELLTRDAIVALRPAPEESIPPHRLDDVLGLTLSKRIEEGEHLAWDKLVKDGDSD